MAITHSLARNPTTNATLGWALLGVLVLTGALSVLGESLLGSVLALGATAVLVVPAALRRDWRVMLPWPLSLVVVVGVAARSLGIAAEISGYVAISAVALAAVVEIDAFTDVEMSRRFAVVFAAMTTVAFQSWWIVVQYASDRWFGTSLLTSQGELQWDLVAVAAVALVMGAVFLWYFDRIEHVGSRNRPVVPEEAA